MNRAILITARVRRLGLLLNMLLSTGIEIVLTVVLIVVMRVARCSTVTAAGSLRLNACGGALAGAEVGKRIVLPDQTGKLGERILATT